MPLKILLINPWQGEIYPPPSIGYLQATILDAGYNVRAVDLAVAMNEPDDYDIIGVTFHSFSVRYAKQIREHFKKAHLVCGGHHPSAMPKQMASIGYDQIVIGEGENAMIDILEGDREQFKWQSSDHYKTINDIPFPDYRGLAHTDNVVISSRGCPFKCNFCASTSFWGNRWKARSADNVIAEINHFGYQSWMFEDDNFTANKKRAIEICSQVKGHWQCASRAETLDDELCHALKKSGCHAVWLGIESFSPASLERCNKNTSVEKMIRGIECAEGHGIRTVCQFIIGLPEDTIHDILLTAKVIRNTRMSDFGGNIAWVLPGTEIYNQAKLRGMTDDVYLESGAPFYTYEHDMDTLLNWRNILMNAKR